VRGRYFNVVDLVNRLEAEGRTVQVRVMACSGPEWHDTPQSL
jgi:hypothetical protein